MCLHVCVCVCVCVCVDTLGMSVYVRVRCIICLILCVCVCHIGESYISSLPDVIKSVSVFSISNYDCTLYIISLSLCLSVSFNGSLSIYPDYLTNLFFVYMCVHVCVNVICI